MPPKGFVWVLAVAFAALVGTAIAPNASAIAPNASAIAPSASAALLHDAASLAAGHRRQATDGGGLSPQPPSGHRRLQSGTCLAATGSCTGMLCGDIDCGAFGTCYEGDCYCTAGYSNPNSLDARVGAGSNVGCSIAEGAATIQTDHTGALSVPADRATIRDGVEAYMAYYNPAVVTVSPGEYSGLRNTNLRMYGKPVRVVAAEDATTTSITCGWSAMEVRPSGAVRRVVEASLDATASGGPTAAVIDSGLEGFAMRGCGSITSLGGAISLRSGAGLTVKRSIIEDNTAQLGGGVYVSGASLALETSILQRNVAREKGGAIYVGAGAVATLMTVMIRENSASVIGGGVVSPHATVSRAIYGPFLTD